MSDEPVTCLCVFLGALNQSDLRAPADLQSQSSDKATCADGEPEEQLNPSEVREAL